MRKGVPALLIVIMTVAIGLPALAGENAALDRTAKKQGAPAAVQYTGFAFKRDPFMAPAAVAAQLRKPEPLRSGQKIDDTVRLPKVDIQGVIWSSTRPQVILNGMVLGVGEYIEQFEIKEILRHSIILFFKGKEYEIRMQSIDYGFGGR